LILFFILINTIDFSKQFSSLLSINKNPSLKGDGIEITLQGFIYFATLGCSELGNCHLWGACDEGSYRS